MDNPLQLPLQMTIKERNIVFGYIHDVERQFKLSHKQITIPSDIIDLFAGFSFGSIPSESVRVLDEQDLKVLDAIKRTFTSQLDKLYPFVVDRFIIGYSHSKYRQRETIEKLQHYLNIYDEFNFDTILDEELENEDRMFEVWPMYLYGYDREGHPVLYDEIGSCNPLHVEAAFGNNIDLVRKYRYRFHKRMANCKRIQCEKYSTIIYKHVMVMDLSGFTAAHFGQNTQIIQRIISEEQNIFPETLHKLFLINVPFVMRMVWKILTPFIHPITLKKIKILGTDYMNDMLKVIHIDQIPPRYGGNGKIEIKVGFCADLPHDRYPL